MPAVRKHFEEPQIYRIDQIWEGKLSRILWLPFRWYNRGYSRMASLESKLIDHVQYQPPAENRLE